MAKNDEVINIYFEWMLNKACEDRCSSYVSFRKLLTFLHSVEFRWSIRNDANRAKDGLDLRYRFAIEHPEIVDAEQHLSGPCSVLEMILSLAIRCEESIMDDPEYGNRTGQWFWGMIVNIGLGSMFDSQFDKVYVAKVVDRFLDRKYSSDGKGGLFTVRDPRKDLRTVEIWYQMCWYLDKFV